MPDFHVEPLQEPVGVRLPGVRVQYLGWAVKHGNRLEAVFRDERRADSYCRRLNALRRTQRVLA